MNGDALVLRQSIQNRSPRIITHGYTLVLASHYKWLVHFVTATITNV